MNSSKLFYSRALIYVLGQSCLIVTLQSAALRAHNTLWPGPSPMRRDNSVRMRVFLVFRTLTGLTSCYTERF